MASKQGTGRKKQRPFPEEDVPKQRTFSELGLLTILILRDHNASNREVHHGGHQTGCRNGNNPGCGNFN